MHPSDSKVVCSRSGYDLRPFGQPTGPVSEVLPRTLRLTNTLKWNPPPVRKSQSDCCLALGCPCKQPHSPPSDAQTQCPSSTGHLQTLHEAWCVGSHEAGTGSVGIDLKIFPRPIMSTNEYSTRKSKVHVHQRMLQSLPPTPCWISVGSTFHPGDLSV